MNEESEAESTPLDGVFVTKVVDEHGNIGTDVMINGTVQATEVQTLLELAVRGWRKRIGLVD
jgi:hypothetical protein